MSALMAAEPVRMPLAEIIGSNSLIIDGDWVESKDQDPDGDVRLIQLADIGIGQFLDKSNRFLTSAKAKMLGCTFLKPGDILVARMPDPIGRACIFPGSLQPCITVVDVCIVRPDPRRIDNRWLSWAINSPLFARAIGKYVKGTTRQRISRTNLETINLPLLSLDEQRRVAAILDLSATLPTKRNIGLATLDTLVAAVFIDMFGNPAENPQGWPALPLSSLVRDNDTINYGVVQPGEDFDGGIPLVRVGDLRDGRVNHATLKRIDPAIEASYKRSRLRGDEILVSCVGSIGAIALADESLKGFNIARAVARIPLADTTNRAFMAAYLRTDFIQRYFIKELRTVSQPTLNIKQLSETKVILPPIGLQGVFACQVAAIEKLKTSYRASLDELNALLASLQNRAFQGEV